MAFAEEHKGEVEASVAKPGMITSPDKPLTSILVSAANLIREMPSIKRTEIATAMLEQVIHGFESDTLSNDDLIRLGKPGTASEPVASKA